VFREPAHRRPARPDSCAWAADWAPAASPRRRHDAEHRSLRHAKRHRVRPVSADRHLRADDEGRRRLPACPPGAPTDRWLTFTAAIAVSAATRDWLATKLTQRRRKIRSRWRLLDPTTQATLVLAFLRTNLTHAGGRRWSAR